MFVYNKVYICVKKQQQRDRFSTHTIAASKTRGKTAGLLGRAGRNWIYCFFFYTISQNLLVKHKKTYYSAKFYYIGAVHNNNHLKVLLE